MVNPNIFAQFAAPRSIADYQGDAQRREANALTLEGVKRKNAMEDMALQQGQARQNALMQIMQGWTPETTVPQRAASLRTNPEFWGEADKLEAADLDAQKARAGIAKDDAETAAKKHQLFKDSLSLIAANPTPEALEVILANLQRKVGDGDAQAGRQLFAGAQTPEQIRERAMRIGLALDKQLPKTGTENLGGSMAYTATDPITGKVTTNAQVPITQSADNAATQATSTANSIRQTGAQRDIAQATRDAAVTSAGATRDAASIRRDQDTEMKLADDYRAQSKDFRDANSAYKQINATLAQATKSPAATLAAATKFMKILDPGSVVRESELGMALAASGVIDRMQNYINTLQRGKVLTETQAKDFGNISGKIYGAAQEVQRRVDADYSSKASKYNLRPDMVIQNIGQNDKLDSPSAPASNPEVDALVNKYRSNK